MSKKIVIIGGGIIGLCSAYHLSKAGHEVVVVDQSNMDGGASYVNAGYLSPSHIIPLSAPGVMAKGIKWMMNPASPLYIKPRLDKEFLKWTWAFNKSCNADHVQKSAPVIRDISVLSQELYQEIDKQENFNTHYVKKGLMMLCQTEKAMESEIAMGDLASSLNLENRVIDKKGISEVEPNVEIDAIGAVYYVCDHHTTPSEFMASLKQNLIDKGVTIFKNEKVLDISKKGNSIESITTDKQTLVADEFVLSAGSWSGEWNRKLGTNILMQAGKGYRINSESATGITVPAILSEAKAAITPMHGFTRFAGTMEIAGINTNINKIRVEAIANAVKRYYPSVSITEEEKDNAACGLRPVTPDGLPYIGKSSKINNMVFAAGHAMMGWSMATATGLLVSQIIDNQKTSMPIKSFSPDRSF
ncbi:D-amino-acid dehydrogenase [Flavobacteriaceae bacterium MAR_2010_188]|nr:D-amino-acid dehydrogenase [Flavobacteriaceae bacterium MAR_2010_188]